MERCPRWSDVRKARWAPELILLMVQFHEMTIRYNVDVDQRGLLQRRATSPETDSQPTPMAFKTFLL